MVRDKRIVHEDERIKIYNITNPRADFYQVVLSENRVLTMLEGVLEDLAQTDNLMEDNYPFSRKLRAINSEIYLSLKKAEIESIFKGVRKVYEQYEKSFAEFRREEGL